jgi:NADPH:quinone reductase-like Zn-dependent oxidoreductase
MNQRKDLTCHEGLAVTEPGSPPALRDDVPAPSPSPTEVVVRVRASSVNPVDNGIAAGMLAQFVEHEFPVILGRDYVGTVEQVGSEVTRYSVGDEVYGFLVHANPTVHDGSWAERIAVPQEISIGAAPEGVDTLTVGAAPLSGITAMMSIDALELSEGDTVLIVGATGGVGSFAVQLAARAGATVVAPALPEDEAYLRELGVSDVVPRDTDLSAGARERHPGGFDAVLNLVSFEPDGFADLLADGGRLASPLGVAGEGPGRTNVMAAPTTENLHRLAGLLADGTVRVPIQATFELAQASDALTALGTTHTQGKLAIRVS